MALYVMLKAEINKSRKIGCEFEFFLPKFGNTTADAVQQTLASILTTNGLPAISRGYSHLPIPNGYDIAVEIDSSISGSWEWSGVPYAAIEMKTRILNGIDEWERIIPKALKIVNDLGGRVNHTCGFHIHLSLDEIQSDFGHIRSLFNLFYRYEPVIFGLLAPSRTNNQYCQAIPLNSYNLFQGCKAERTYIRAISQLHNKNGLNLSHLISGSAFAYKPRIELRYHGGTLEPEKARHWLRFCLQMAEHAKTRSCQSSVKQVLNNRVGLEKLLIACGFKVNNNIYAEVCPELRETGKYLIQRWKKFNGDISLSAAKKAAKK
jgi:hypothetical protein